MKRELFSLAIEGIKGKKRSSMLLMLVLVLSFAFAVITLSVTGSMEKTNEEYRYDTYGTWYAGIPQGKDRDEEFLRENECVDQLGISKVYGKIALGTTGIGTVDETLKEIGRIDLQDGHFPEKADEIAMEADVLSTLGYDYELGQEISLNITVPVEPSMKSENKIQMIDVTQKFILCGVLKEYSNLWDLMGESQSEGNQVLNGAVIAENGAKNLMAEAEKLAREQKVTFKEPLSQYFFTIKQGKEMQIQGELDQWMDTTRTDGENGTFCINDYAFQDASQIVYHYFYLGMILVTTLLAVVCIYMVQLQKQVRQIALFRSIGITKWQLGKMLFYETLCISIPAAVIGILSGILGTFGILKILMRMSKATVHIQVSIVALCLMIAVWIFGIFGVRLLVFYVSLRQPLTGRIRMEHRKASRYRKIRKMMVALLASIFCGGIFFAVMQALPEIRSIKYWKTPPSYTIDAESAFIAWVNETEQKMITVEMAEKMEQVPGINSVDAFGRMAVEMKFKGMEDCALSALYLDEEIWREKIGHPEFDCVTNNAGEEVLIPFQEGAGVNLFGIREKNWSDYFDAEELGIDKEAFRSGEQVIVAVPVNVDGNIEVASETYEDCGLKKGDEIELGLYGEPMKEGRVPNGGWPNEKVGTTRVKVGAVKYAVPEQDAKTFMTNTEPYTIICSEKLLERMLQEATSGYICRDRYLTGGEFGYSDMCIYTDINAGYLSTDYLVADICASHGLSMINNREMYAAYIQGGMQKLILLFSGCISICLILILVIWNTLRLEAEEEKKSFGILQAIGMSQRQMKKKIFGKSLLTGVTAVIGGWLIYVLYCLVFVLQEQKRQIQVLGKAETFEKNLKMLIETRRLSGANLGVVIGIGIAGIAVIVLIYYVSKRCLFDRNVLAKLRDER